MALLFFEGFEQYSSTTALISTQYMSASSMPGRWYSCSDTTNTTLDSGTYRTVQPAGSSKSLKCNVPSSGSPSVTMSFPSSGTVILGIGMVTNTSLTNWKVRIGSPSTSEFYSSTHYLTLNCNSSGSLILANSRTSTTLISTAANTFIVGVWHYIEIKMTFGASGSVQLIVDGTTVGTASSVNTQSHTSDTGYNRICLGYPNGIFSAEATYFDDIYVCNSTGPTHNDFLGGVRVYTLFPTANGTTNQFSPTGVASNWDAVNEQAPDTTTYVASSTASEVDKYTVTDLAVNPTTIHAVAVCSLALKTENSSRQFRNNVTVSSTTTNGNSVTPITGSYLSNQDIFTTAPGGSAWTLSDVNNMEIGIETL